MKLGCGDHCVTPRAARASDGILVVAMVSDTLKTLPTVDLASGIPAAAEQLDRACREFGFFYLVGHGVDTSLVAELTRLSRQFFAQSLEDKLRIHMSKGGRAWRGYFPVGEELTSGVADQKEGIYFG